MAGIPGSLKIFREKERFFISTPITPVLMRFKDQLAGCVPGSLLSNLTDRYDVIGTVAIISIPASLENYKFIIAEALCSHRHSIKTVLNKIAPVVGSSRTARYEFLVGNSAITTCREYGFEYELDVLTSFFNPMLSTERKRVADMVLPGEFVLVPFSGVGPFVVPAAAKGAAIVAIEQNPDAFRWLCRNIRKNRVRSQVTAIMGDAFDTSLLPGPVFDRIIIPTPYGMDAILDVLVQHLKPGGMIHFYTFQNTRQIPGLRDMFCQSGYEVVSIRMCGNVAPCVARWVFDLKRLPR
jgi:tRNA (guanine37-N1)-methyltransferase